MATDSDSDRLTTSDNKSPMYSDNEDEKSQVKQAQLGLNSNKYEENQKPFACTKCDMRYMSVSALNVHIKTKHRQVTYDCQLCSKSYTSVQKCRDHMFAIHKNFRYICHRCKPGPGQEFTTDYALKKHTKEVHKRFNLVISKTPMRRTEGLTPSDLHQVCVDYSGVIERRKDKKNRKENLSKHKHSRVHLPIV